MDVRSAFSKGTRIGLVPGDLLAGLPIGLFAGLFVVLAATLLACSAPSTSKVKSVRQQSFTIIALAELRGTIEPCGCNSDPLGDIARTAEIVTSLRAQGKPVLVVDGGSLLYTAPQPSKLLMAQEKLRSELIAEVYANDLKVAAVGLGPHDFAEGKNKVRPARQAANVARDIGIAIEEPKIENVGGVPVGIFGVVAPDALAALGVKPSDPVEAAKQAVATLRGHGARVIVGLAYMLDSEAKPLARKVPGIDFLVIARNAPEPDQTKSAPSRVGDTFVVAPANRGQIVTRLDVTLREGQDGPLHDALGESRAAVELTKLDKQIAELTANLATWKADPDASSKFVTDKEAELERLSTRRESLDASPTQIPPEGGFFTMTQIRINKELACHVAIQKAKQAFDKAAGAANVAAAADVKPLAVLPGKPVYAGIEACSECHEEQVEFWKKTKHHQAWETLDTLGKQFDYECIGCHVTGWDKPGGATLAKNEALRDVQCEQCHGAGSLHIDGDGDPEHITREPPESTCKQCHNKEHSDTFDYTAYLRDVTGEGHGPEFRAKLADGKTGHELRSAALAGKVKGKNCLK